MLHPANIHLSILTHLQHILLVSLRRAGLMYLTMFAAATFVKLAAILGYMRYPPEEHKLDHGVFWLLCRITVSVLKTSLTLGCGVAFSLTSQHVPKDSNLPWFAVFVLIGSGSVLASVSPSRIASKLVENQLPGRVAFSSCIGTSAGF
jgi:hypothetical protein